MSTSVCLWKKHPKSYFSAVWQPWGRLLIRSCGTCGLNDFATENGRISELQTVRQVG